MEKYQKSKLYQWVTESFGDDSSGTTFNVNDTSRGMNSQFAGVDKTGGQNIPVKQDIAGEELKHKFGGINSFKELKHKADSAAKDIRTSADDCLKKECTVESYVNLLDVIQNPEVLSTLEHMRQEFKLRELESDKYR